MWRTGVFVKEVHIRPGHNFILWEDQRCFQLAANVKVMVMKTQMICHKIHSSCLLNAFPLWFFLCCSPRRP